mmetsp:Transcript_25325/g.53501  ORF Transcript_25325/g.53501 Transcript_25325/m.53501 type:complete len:895 (-) Transcript_25325:24-2708(-)
MASTNATRTCQWCQREGRLSTCFKCKLVDYCNKECQASDWRAGHKILCSKVPKAVKKAEEKIASFHLRDYTTRNVGTFMVTEAQARRGEIIEENEAQEMCWDAMEMIKGSAEKLLQILEALECFPLSTEAWGMLGHFYQYEVTLQDDKKKRCAAAALKMYDNSILCARKLNPTWVEDRSDELVWGEMENRPYLRSLLGRAIAFKDAGKRRDAIAQAKKLMRLNPNDNQGVRKLLCTWFLEARDTEGCTNILRKYGTNNDSFMAYTDVMLQYVRWKKDDAIENEVKKALYTAIKANPYVSNMLGDDSIKKDDEEDPYYSPGDKREAKNYAVESQKLWRRYPEVIDWIKSQKYVGEKKPSEDNLIDLLKSGIKFQMTCIHSDLEGNDTKESTLIGTQNRGECIGCGLEDFNWPRRLNRPHEPSSDIIVHHNIFRESGWRKTKYMDVQEVPYWRIYLQFYEEDPDNKSDSWDKAPPSYHLPDPIETARSNRVLASSAKCKVCNSNGKFCALDNDCTAFYCSKSCMKDFLEESDPPFFDLQSKTLKVRATEDCSINTIDLDDAFRVAAEHMTNLNSVDIYISQDYIIKNQYSFGSEVNRVLLLSPNELKQFLEKMRTKLISFSFRIGDCCWKEMKKMTDKCRALLPLGTMPNLKKLELSNFGFDDVETLTSCLSNELQLLRLHYVKMGTHLDWKSSEVDALVNKLSELKYLVTLGLPDSSINDQHLWDLLPKLQFLRCLDVSGTFGSGGSLTEFGLRAIADNCPELLSLQVNYQPRMTINGIMYLLQKCPELVDLEVGGVITHINQMRQILNSAKKLRVLWFGAIGWRPETRGEQLEIQRAVQATEGRVVLCTVSGGKSEVNLSAAHRRNQDDSIAKFERAGEQDQDPLVCNMWDGIL